MKTITKHYIDGAFGDSHGREVLDIISPTNGKTIAREEIFGPVLCVIAYDTEEDAIRIANDTSFGLHAYVNGTTWSARAAWPLSSSLVA